MLALVPPSLTITSTFKHLSICFSPLSRCRSGTPEQIQSGTSGLRLSHCHGVKSDTKRGEVTRLHLAKRRRVTQGVYRFRPLCMEIKALVLFFEEIVLAYSFTVTEGSEPITRCQGGAYIEFATPGLLLHYRLIKERVITHPLLEVTDGLKANSNARL